MAEHMILEKSKLFHNDVERWRVVTHTTTHKNVTELARAIVKQTGR